MHSSGLYRLLIIIFAIFIVIFGFDSALLWGILGAEGYSKNILPILGFTLLLTGVISLILFFEINRSIKQAKKISETRAQEHAKTLMEVVNYNPITGLPNRDLFNVYLSGLLTKAKTEHKQVLLLIVTIRGFREISQAFGEETSKEYLKAFSKQLNSNLPHVSGMGHIETTHFAISQMGEFEISQIQSLAEWLLSLFKNPLMVDNHSIVTAVNVGIAVSPYDGLDAPTLLKHAMIAINQAKEKGQNTIQFYEKGMNLRVEERRRLMTDLHSALQRDEFMLYFQPKVNLKSMKIQSAEVLIRWKHGKRGLISPSLFISLLEESRLMVPVGDWLIKSACMQGKAWHIEGLYPLSLSVNLSPVQLKEEKLVEFVNKILIETHFPAQNLELEITESAIIGHLEQTIGTLKALGSLGVILSMDDFGTGYSSLNYIKQLPVQKLKIDQSFVSDLKIDKKEGNVIDSIIHLGHNLGLKMIAEGIETQEQLEYLKSAGCDEGQGYYFSKPIPADEFVDFYKRFNDLG